MCKVINIYLKFLCNIFQRFDADALSIKEINQFYSAMNSSVRHLWGIMKLKNYAIYRVSGVAYFKVCILRKTYKGRE